MDSRNGRDSRLTNIINQSKTAANPYRMVYPVTTSLRFGEPSQTILMNPVALAVDDLRDQYLREMALVRQTFERTGDGTAAIRRRSAVVDRILIEMWRRAFAGQPAQNVSLLAL